MANYAKQSADPRLELPFQLHPIVFRGQTLCRELGLQHQDTARPIPGVGGFAMLLSKSRPSGHGQ